MTDSEVLAARIPHRWAFFGAAVVMLLAVGLWLRVQAPALPPAPAAMPPSSVVVVPFVGAVPNEESVSIGVGLAEVISGMLGRVPGLRVGGISSAAAFAQRGDSLRGVGRRLGVGSVLAGSVRLTADRVRLAVRLVDVENGFDLWSEVYDVSMAELPFVPQRIASTVVEALRRRGGISDTLASAPVPTTSAEAFRQYLLARAAIHPEAAIASLARAIELDPRFAPAHAELARTYVTLLGTDSLAPSDLMPRARDAAKTALSLDSTLAEAHLTLALVHFLFDHDWDAASRSFRRAVAQNPSLSDIHLWYARFLLAMSRPEEAMVAARRARALDPANLDIRLYFAWHALLVREYPDARLALREAAALFPLAWEPAYFQGLVARAEGDTAEAMAQLAEAQRRAPTQVEPLAVLGWAHAMAGRAGQARRTLVELRTLSRERYVSPVLIAYIHAALGERRAAFAWLDRGIRDRAPALVYLRNDPRADALRGDQRYPAALRRLGLSRP